MPTAFQLACPPIPLVRIAIVGLGQRGMKTLERYADIQGAEIVCLADLNDDRLLLAQEALKRTGRPKARAFTGKDAWQEACRQPEVDLVYICTEWRSHTPIAVVAMECGKHVAVEVPAATTIDECWQLVRTAEATQRHCFMTENCCYDLVALQTLEMHRRGLLGQITHLEGAYIHNLTVPSRHHSGGITDTRQNWMERSCALHGGNPYPTHGMGPMAQLLGLHREDRLEWLVSVTAEGVALPGQPPKGRVNTALLRTRKGVTLMLQLDVTTPRPYSRIQTVCGTLGFVQKYPLTTVQLEDTEALTGDAALQYLDQFSTSPAALLWKKGHELGVPNEMNFAMDARLIYCLQEGLPLDIDVYDAAEWSCLAELTQQSANLGGMPVRIPDFMGTP